MKNMRKNYSQMKPTLRVHTHITAKYIHNDIIYIYHHITVNLLLGRTW